LFWFKIIISAVFAGKSVSVSLPFMLHMPVQFDFTCYQVFHGCGRYHRKFTYPEKKRNGRFLQEILYEKSRLKFPKILKDILRKLFRLKSNGSFQKKVFFQLAVIKQNSKKSRMK